MAHRVCPWWLGYWLLFPLRRFWHDPSALLSPFVREGMTVLEPGPGMGFFTLELANRVGGSGKVLCVDVQPRMLEVLRRRLAAAGLSARVEARLAPPESMGLADAKGRVDFCLAFAVAHEFPDTAKLFRELCEALRPGGRVLLAEPVLHVPEEDFDAQLAAAAAAGLAVVGRPAIRLSHAVVLEKKVPA